MSNLSQPVVLLHGLWCGALHMALLARRLRACGFSVLVLSYPSTRRSPAANARALVEQLQAYEKPHFVAHSLGGLVVRHILAQAPAFMGGRVVLLGTPREAAASARRLHAWRWARWSLGRSVEAGLVGGAPPWPVGCERGVIAGTLPLGMGVATGALRGAHDGAVAVAETRDPFARDFATVHTNHMGLLLSSATARLACRFLHTGRFEPVSPAPDADPSDGS